MLFLRRLTLAALALALIIPAAPARAEDDLVRQLVNACTGCRFPKDLHGRDLHGLHFTGADLRGVDFSRANLNGAVFTGADLADARFDDADLRNARFTGVRFRNTSFARAKVDGIEMTGVRIDARSIVGIDYRRFVNGCTGCDLSEMPLSNMGRRLRPLAIHPIIPPDIAWRLREMDMRPPVISPDVERKLRDIERELRGVERELRLHPPVIPPIPPLPPMPQMAPIPPMPASPVIPPAPPAPPPAGTNA
jgi:hypothetical protein